jgi:hypothetical protein
VLVVGELFPEVGEGVGGRDVGEEARERERDLRESKEKGSAAEARQELRRRRASGWGRRQEGGMGEHSGEGWGRKLEREGWGVARVRWGP